VQRKQFERRVAEALASIPRRFRDAMQNIAIVVEDEPSAELLEDMDIEPPDTLLGLYQGTPLTERTSAYGNVLPDRVLIFQGPHERESEDDDDLVVCIGETLIHEIGHYFGLSEEEIEEIEEKYWRGEDDAGEPGDDVEEVDDVDDDGNPR
jgi:predicted Zn-dependent protease with MMP-like domain